MDDDFDIISNVGVKHNTRVAELHDWQEKAIDFFFATNLAIFEASTGTGKTRVAIEIIKRVFKENPSAKILIVVPKNVILEEGWYTELYENGFSIRDIGLFYGKTKELARITLTNVQNVLKMPYDMFEMVVVDEAHHISTRRLETFINHKFKYKLGLTATVERIDGLHLNLMKTFGYNVFRYTPKEALQDKVLNPFNFVNIAVRLDPETRVKYDHLNDGLHVIFQMHGGYDRIMRTGSEQVRAQMLGLLNKRKMLLANYPRKFFVVRKIVGRHRNDKIIVFNNYNEQTTKCYWEIMEEDVPTCIVHTGIPEKLRQKNLRGFRKDKFRVMLTTKMLDEGYNLRSIDVGVIMAGDSTDTQTIQRMGRVLRKKDKHSSLYQVFVKDTVEETHSLKRSKIFKALCSEYEEYTYDGENDFEWKK